MKKDKIYAFLVVLLITLPTMAQKKVSLDESVKSALAHNVAIKNAELNYEGAKATKDEAFTKYFPTITALGGGLKANKGLFEMGLSGMQLSMMKEGLYAGVTAVQPIFVGGRIINGNKLAEVGMAVKSIQREQSANEVRLTVSQLYWQRVSLREKMKTVEAMDSLLQSVYQDVALAVKAGLRINNDLLQVRLRRNEVAAQRLKLKNAMAVTKDLFEQFTGLGNCILADEIPDEMPKPDFLRVDHQAALPTTVAYRLLDKQVEAAKIQKRIELGKYLPSLSVGASFMDESLVTDNRTLGLVFATVSVPISDWWGGSKALKRKRIAMQIAQNNRQDLGEKLVIKMSNDWHSLTDSYEQVKLSNESIQLSEDNYRMHRDYYKAGTSTMSDLLEAQSLLLKSKDQYTEDCTNYLVNKVIYLEATGR